jgi:hypothetical protein
MFRPRWAKDYETLATTAIFPTPVARDTKEVGYENTRFEMENVAHVAA